MGKIALSPGSRDCLYFHYLYLYHDHADLLDGIDLSTERDTPYSVYYKDWHDEAVFDRVFVPNTDSAKFLDLYSIGTPAVKRRVLV